MDKVIVKQDVLELALELAEVKDHDIKLFTELNRLVKNALELKFIKDNLILNK